MRDPLKPFRILILYPVTLLGTIITSGSSESTIALSSSSSSYSTIFPSSEVIFGSVVGSAIL